MVLAAVAENGHALKHASAELRGDKEVVLAAIAKNGDVLDYASAELRADKEVVLAAVAQHGYLLDCASAELRGDKEVVLAAVAQHGYLLEHASAELRGDSAVVQAALESNPDAWRWVDADQKRLLRLRPEVMAARATAETATAVLAQLAKRRRPTSDDGLDRLDYAIALIAKRFPALQDAAQDASARLHNPWTAAGRWSTAHKRDRAAFECEVRA